MNEINIKKQFPQHFLINDSSGEVARKLNSYIGIEEIDIAQKSINSKITDYKSKIKIYKEDTVDLEKEYEELSFVDSLDILVSNIEKNHNNIEKDVIFLLSCKACVDDITSVIEAIDNQKAISELSNIIKKLTDEVVYIDDCEMKLDNLKTTIKNIKKIKISIQEYNGVLKYSDQLDNINKQVCAIDDKKLYEISKLVDNIQRIENEIVKISSNIGVLTKTFKSTMKEAKECPLCGSTILEKS